ncbi:MAG: hypothetical protein II718_00190 [Clostridiales bacterium]|nr:hypothetical protein [Clostridiales bacterium]
MNTVRKIIITVIVSCIALAGFASMMVCTAVAFATVGSVAEIVEGVFLGIYLIVVLAGIILFIIDRKRAKKEKRPPKDFFTLWFVSSISWAAVPLLLYLAAIYYYNVVGGEIFP